MHLLSHLHGTLAAVVLCTLLFVDESGIPLPLAPNEALLLFGGVLIQTRVLHAWLFVPAAAVVMGAGMLTGYAWAYAVGQGGLTRLADRFGGARLYARAQTRLSGVGPPGMFLARLLPGVRPWATLVAGASGRSLRSFLVGAVPALLVWEAVWIALGIVVGLPAAHYFGVFERLLWRGAALCVLGLLAYAAVRRLRATGVLTDAQIAVMRGLMLLLAFGAIASLTAGALAVLRGLLHIRHHTGVDVLVIFTVLVGSAAVGLLRRHTPAATRSTGSQ